MTYEGEATGPPPLGSFGALRAPQVARGVASRARPGRGHLFVVRRGGRGEVVRAGQFARVVLGSEVHFCLLGLLYVRIRKELSSWRPGAGASSD